MASTDTYIQKSNRCLSIGLTLRGNLTLVDLFNLLSEYFQHPVYIHWHTIRIWSLLLVCSHQVGRGFTSPRHHGLNLVLTPDLGVKGF